MVSPFECAAGLGGSDASRISCVPSLSFWAKARRAEMAAINSGCRSTPCCRASGSIPPIRDRLLYGGYAPAQLRRSAGGLYTDHHVAPLCRAVTVGKGDDPRLSIGGSTTQKLAAMAMVGDSRAVAIRATSWKYSQRGRRSVQLPQPSSADSIRREFTLAARNSLSPTAAFWQVGVEEDRGQRIRLTQKIRCCLRCPPTRICERCFARVYGQSFA